MTTTAWAREGVNAVVGDDSYVARFGVMPDASVDEDVRLRVHLEYVEALLRARSQEPRRVRMLDLLHVYISRGEFPRNHEVSGRRPHFIDEDGRICAVGYLIEQTAGRAAAEAINARHEWDFIGDIEGIEAWVAASGLSVEELAMIQPSYDWRDRPVPEVPPRAPPPPPPRDEQRIIVAALAYAQPGVDRCAARYEAWGESVTVTVNVHGKRLVSFRASKAGGRSFERCVELAVRKVVIEVGGTKRTVRAAYTFTIPARPDRKFASPPLVEERSR